MIYWNGDKIVWLNFRTRWLFYIVRYAADMDVEVTRIWDKDTFSDFIEADTSFTPHKESIRPRQTEDRSDPELRLTDPAAGARFIGICCEHWFKSRYSSLLYKVYLFVLLSEKCIWTSQNKKYFTDYILQFEWQVIILSLHGNNSISLQV